MPVWGTDGEYADRNFRSSSVSETEGAERQELVNTAGGNDPNQLGLPGGSVSGSFIVRKRQRVPR